MSFAVHVAVGEQSAVLQLHFGHFALEDELFFSVSDEALYFFVVLDGCLELFFGLLVVGGFLVGEGEVVVIDEHVIVEMFFAGGVGAVLGVLPARGGTLISCWSCPSREMQLWVSLSLTASAMTLSLRVVMVDRCWLSRARGGDLALLTFRLAAVSAMLLILN